MKVLLAKRNVIWVALRDVLAHSSTRYGSCHFRTLSNRVRCIGHVPDSVQGAGSTVPTCLVPVALLRAQDDCPLSCAAHPCLCQASRPSSLPRNNLVALPGQGTEGPQCQHLYKGTDLGKPLGSRSEAGPGAFPSLDSPRRGSSSLADVQRQPGCGGRRPRSTGPSCWSRGAPLWTPGP